MLIRSYWYSFLCYCETTSLGDKISQQTLALKLLPLSPLRCSLNAVLLKILLIFITFSFIQPSHYLLLVCPSTAPHPISSLVSKMFSIPARPPHSLGPQASGGLGASSPTEARPGSPLLYMCWETQTPSCVLPGG